MQSHGDYFGGCHVCIGEKSHSPHVGDADSDVRRPVLSTQGDDNVLEIHRHLLPRNLFTISLISSGLLKNKVVFRFFGIFFFH